MGQDDMAVTNEHGLMACLLCVGRRLADADLYCGEHHADNNDAELDAILGHQAYHLRCQPDR